RRTTEEVTRSPVSPVRDVPLERSGATQAVRSIPETIQEESMKRDLFAVLVLVAAVATAMPCSNAAADDNAAGPMGGLGCRSTDARIGHRWRLASPFGAGAGGRVTSATL